VPRGKARRSLELIEASTEVLREIQPATVRAVCYRLFTLGLIDSMAKTETNRVGRQLTDARETCAIPWDWIVDETRSVESAPTWSDPEEFADAVSASYKRQKWTAQPARVEVWSEKGTVRGTLQPVLDAYDVPHRVMHGFASATTVHEIARGTGANEQPCVALYIGDFDPSGLHMSAIDLPARLTKYGATTLTIERVALTDADVSDADLPSFDLENKFADPRAAWFRRHYGLRCWELDALSPVTLRDRVEAAIVAQLDHEAWRRYVDAERVERESITRSVRAWRQLTEHPEPPRRKVAIL
jgi:hypothetical protein